MSQPMRSPGMESALAKSPSTMVLGSALALGRITGKVQRVIHLVDDERNAARSQRFGELALLARRHDRARRVVRRVHEHGASAVIHDRQHLIRGLRKALLASQCVLAHLEAPGARQHRHRRIHGLRQARWSRRLRRTGR